AVKERAGRTRPALSPSPTALRRLLRRRDTVRQMVVPCPSRPYRVVVVRAVVGVRVTVPVRSNFACPLGVAEPSSATGLNRVAGRGLRQRAKIGVDRLELGVGHAVVGRPRHRLQYLRIKAGTGASPLGCRTNWIDHAAV